MAVVAVAPGRASLIPNICRVSRRADSEIRNLGYMVLSEESLSSPSSESLLLVLGGGLKI